MKLSNKILEQYKIDSLEVAKGFPHESNVLDALFTGLGKTIQAYKDALFMEGEIQKRDSEESTLKECAEQWDKACDISGD